LLGQVYILSAFILAFINYIFLCLKNNNNTITSLIHISFSKKK